MQNNQIEFAGIEELRGIQISNIAGVNSHHFFALSNDGKVFAFVKNDCGRTSEKYFLPVETMVTKGSTFCIVGEGLSVVFNGFIPPNTPNMKVGHDKEMEFPMSFIECRQKIKELKKEISSLKSKISHFGGQNSNETQNIQIIEQSNEISHSMH